MAKQSKRRRVGKSRPVKSKPQLHASIQKAIASLDSSVSISRAICVAAAARLNDIRLIDGAVREALWPTLQEIWQTVLYPAMVDGRLPMTAVQTRSAEGEQAARTRISKAPNKEVPYYWLENSNNICMCWDRENAKFYQPRPGTEMLSIPVWADEAREEILRTAGVKTASNGLGLRTSDGVGIMHRVVDFDDPNIWRLYAGVECEGAKLTELIGHIAWPNSRTKPGPAGMVELIKAADKKLFPKGPPANMLLKTRRQRISDSLGFPVPARTLYRAGIRKKP